MRPKRNNEVETRILPDGYVVLFNTKNNWAHTLTPLGALTWELCDGQVSIDEIVDRIVELVGSETVDRKLKEQITTLVDQLSELDLVIYDEQIKEK